jgi:nucleoside 2-deoxyribosyltransferase
MYGGGEMNSIYIAAPLFSECELSFNRQIRGILSTYMEAYLPQEDGDLLTDMLADGQNLKEAMGKIFSQDLRAIEKSNYLLIVLDGRTIDEGASFELGYAYAKNKTCVALQTDGRRLLPTGNNPMIEQAVEKTFKTLQELENWAKRIALAERTGSNILMSGFSCRQ